MKMFVNYYYIHDCWQIGYRRAYLVILLLISLKTQLTD